MALAKLGKWGRWAAVLWGTVLLLVCLHTILAPASHTTYPIFATAGRNWLAGQPLYGAAGGGVKDVYRYSPLVAALFAPLSQLPDGPAGALWRLVNAGALLGALGWWSRAVLPPASSGDRRALLLLLVLPLAVPSLHNGQSNALVLALVLAAVAGAAEGRWNLSSACVALACLFKLYPLAVGLLLAALYPRRLIGRLALALAAGLALPFLLQQPAYVAAGYGHWAEWLARDDRCTRPLCCWPRDLRLLCQVWLVPLPTGLYPVLQVLAGAACAGLCLAARARDGDPRRQLTLLTALACGWMTAFGPATESSTYILLGPSLAALLLEVGPSTSWRLRAPLWGAYGLLVGTYASKWFPWGRLVSTLGLQPLAALIFLGCLLAVALGKLRRGEQPEAVRPPTTGLLGRAAAAVLLLLLPVTASAQQVEAVPPPVRRGIVFVVGGVGGFDTMPYTAQVAWQWAGLPHEVHDFVWTHGWGQMFKDLQDTPHVRHKAQQLAAMVRNAHDREPDRPIYLVAKSGGAGLALMTADYLPPATLERLVLLSAAVSPAYDLRPALRATRREVVSFYSSRDHVILNWGTRTFGTIDRQYTPSAGLRGFTAPPGLTAEEQALYGRLVQVPWKARMLMQGYGGMHSGTSSPFFLANEVAPWLKD